jgi:PhnB protein
MPKRSPAVELDLAISTLLARPRAFVDTPDAGDDAERAKLPAAIARLLPLVRDLRAMPRPDFKARLKLDLHKRSFAMQTAARYASSEQPSKFRRPNFPNIAPYFLVHGGSAFIDFLVAAFEGTESIRVPRPDGSIMHASVTIGNSVIELGDANEQYPERPMITHLYVTDADATFARALHAGATAVYAPTDNHPSGDRWGEAKDPFGNTWYIATRRGWTGTGPEDFLTVQPYLQLRNAHEMIPFIEAAFGAEATGVHKTPEGLVLHATVELAGATFEIQEAPADARTAPAYLHAYVPDTDALYARAVAAGAKGTQAPYTAPYGDRAATIEDPFGNSWFLATYLGPEAEPGQ